MLVGVDGAEDAGVIGIRVPPVSVDFISCNQDRVWVLRGDLIEDHL